MLVELGGETLFGFIGYGVGFVAGIAPRTGAMALVTIGSIILWSVVAVLIFPWYTALIVDDRSMGFRRSIRPIASCWPSSWALFVGGALPLMALHYALGYASLGITGPAIWAVMVIDAGLVALMVTTIASAYYTIYLRAGA